MLEVDHDRISCQVEIARSLGSLREASFPNSRIIKVVKPMGRLARLLKLGYDREIITGSYEKVGWLGEYSVTRPMEVVGEQRGYVTRTGPPGNNIEAVITEDGMLRDVLLECRRNRYQRGNIEDGPLIALQTGPNVLTDKYLPKVALGYIALTLAEIAETTGS